MIKLLVYAVLLWVGFKIWKLVQGVDQRRSPPRRPPTGKVEGGELVQDPECGVYVPKDSAVRDARGEYFCSEACREAHAEKRG